MLSEQVSAKAVQLKSQTPGQTAEVRISVQRDGFEESLNLSVTHCPHLYNTSDYNACII